MREILFRAKRIAVRDWVEGFYVHVPKGRWDDEEHLIQTIKEDGRIGTLRNIDPDTLGQFTGLTDKNGKKIFEGDIVKAKSSHPCGGDVIGTVVISLDDYELMWDIDHSHEIEVIGNIHDNPELLEGHQ